MSKRKTMDKAQARERRNRLLESAAAAQLSLTDGVREMRAISGMTQEEFARHREVSARVIKALELDQGNPTVATLNRIGQFFGLEVAFVPIKKPATGLPAAFQTSSEAVTSIGHHRDGSGEKYRELVGDTPSEAIVGALEAREHTLRVMRHLDDVLADLDTRLDRIVDNRRRRKAATSFDTALDTNTIQPVTKRKSPSS